MKLTPKEKAKELYTLFSKHAKYWDCYNDSPLEIDHTKQCVLIVQKNLLNKLKELNIVDEFEEEVLFEINAL